MGAEPSDWPWPGLIVRAVTGPGVRSGAMGEQTEKTTIYNLQVNRAGFYFCFHFFQISVMHNKCSKNWVVFLNIIWNIHSKFTLFHRESLRVQAMAMMVASVYNVYFAIWRQSPESIWVTQGYPKPCQRRKESYLMMGAGRCNLPIIPPIDLVSYLPSLLLTPSDIITY